MQHHRLTPRVACEQGHLSGISMQQPQQHANCRCLSGAVRPEQAMHLASGNAKIQPVEGTHAAERLHQTSRGDRVSHEIDLPSGRPT